MDMNWFLPLQDDVLHVDHDPSPLPVVPEYDGVHLPVVDNVSPEPPAVVSEDEIDEAAVSNRQAAQQAGSQDWS